MRRCLLSRLFLVFLAALLAVPGGASTPDRVAFDLAGRHAFFADDARRELGERLALRAVERREKTDANPAPGVFGYAGITSIDLLREVSPFSNIVSLDPRTVDFGEMVRAARQRSMKIALGWDGIVFDTSSEPYQLREDYQERIADVLSQHPDIAFETYFNILDEPYWRGAAPEDIEKVVVALREALPRVPTTIILAWPMLDVLTEPVPSAWVGFDLYHVADPVSDPMYQFYWNRMQELNPDKPIVVVADGHFGRAHAAAGLSESDMGAVLRGYVNLYAMEPKSRALGVFIWNDTPDLLGTRSFPDSVVREHIELGAALTDRCGIPSSEAPLAGETVLWFHDCRFYARLTVDDPERTSVTSGVGANQTDQSGYFWFFDEVNVEVTIKVLDGRALNGHFWVSSSDMTDINYRLEIFDTVTGNIWTHANVGGLRPTARDTEAFPAAP